jgi:hypothetical protein
MPTKSIEFKEINVYFFAQTCEITPKRGFQTVVAKKKKLKKYASPSELLLDE